MLVRKKTINKAETGSLILVLLLMLLILPSLSMSAQGNLLITPRRVVFDGSSRSMDLNLANTGQDSATYSISLVQIRMTEDGQFETITEPDPGQKFADPFIRYFPRSVTLAPNEAQVVKVQVTRRSQLEKGEYRSHFYFRAEKKPTPLGEDDHTVEDNSISVRLTPVFGITIPVIIRMGDLSADIKIDGINLSEDENGKPVLDMVFNRSGDRSVYGNLVVNHISPSGKLTRVAIANGIAVYTPNTIRKFRISLVQSNEFDYSEGKLNLTFSAPSDLEAEIYATAELELR